MPDYTPNFAGIVDALKTIITSGIAGSGATQAQIKAAIEAATNLGEIQTRLMPAGSFSTYLGTSAGASLKAAAGVVYAFTCTNNNATTRYFQIFNKASIPLTGDSPLLCFPIGYSDSLLVVGQDTLGGGGIILSTGIAWGFSTTRLTYTAGLSTDCIATMRWT